MPGRCRVGEQGARQRHVLELPEVADVVVRREPAPLGPLEGQVRAPLTDPHPGPSGRDGLHVGGEVAVVDPLRLVEQGERAGQVAVGLADAGLGDAPAVRGARQAEVVAELVGDPEVLAGGREVAALVVDHAQPDVHVGGAADGPRGLARDQVEPVAEGTLRGPQPAQGQLQLGHRDGAAEDVGHVADALEAPDGLGVRRLGRRDVALAPGRQAHEGGRGAVTQVVVRVEHDDRLPGAVDGGGHVPDHQGQARAVDLDPPREACGIARAARRAVRPGASPQVLLAPPPPSFSAIRSRGSTPRTSPVDMRAPT